jgi:hypothetical protein
LLDGFVHTPAFRSDRTHLPDVSLLESGHKARVNALVKGAEHCKEERAQFETARDVTVEDIRKLIQKSKETE